MCSFEGERQKTLSGLSATWTCPLPTHSLWRLPDHVSCHGDAYRYSLPSWSMIQVWIFVMEDVDDVPHGAHLCWAGASSCEILETFLYSRDIIKPALRPGCLSKATIVDWASTTSI